MIKLLNILKEIRLDIPFNWRQFKVWDIVELGWSQNNPKTTAIIKKIFVDKDRVNFEFKTKNEGYGACNYYFHPKNQEQEDSNESVKKLKKVEKTKLQEIRIDTSSYYKIHNLTPGDKFTSTFIWNKYEITKEGRILGISIKPDGSAYIQIDVGTSSVNANGSLHHQNIYVPSPNEELDWNGKYGLEFLRGLRVIK